MKKIIGAVMSFLLVFGFCLPLVSCTPRDQQLKIYNWGEYMDESIFPDFEKWYEEQTGSKIKVNYKEFSTNEEMEYEIATNKSDYDLICPSDYMLDKMKKNNLLVKIDKDIVYGGQKTEDIINPKLMDLIATYDEGLEYSVPYMWGTLGIMYDKDKIAEISGASISDMDSWNVMFNTQDNKYIGKMYMKNSERDSFAAANIYRNSQSLSEKSLGFTDYNTEEYRSELEKIMSDSDAISAVGAVLTAQKQAKLVFQYENDEGKDALVTGENDVVFGLFWSCDAGYAMSENVDDSENFNYNLWYTVPKEGSNVWVDSFAIPTTSANQTAAQYFLKYICQKDIAYKNMDAAGASTPIIAAAEEYKEYVDSDDFFIDFSKAPEGFEDMYIDMMFPSDETLERCAIMRDFGDKTADLKEMWANAKAS